ncbi:MAG: AMP-binding protein [Terracidiphilus sp.]
MRDHLATLIDDFRLFNREVAVVRYQGNRRRVTTYGELARLAGRFAALLALREIGPGDRVLIWGENSAEWISAFYGCMLRGVLAVPLDMNGTPDFAVRVAADVNPRLAVGDAQLLAKLTATVTGPTFPTLAFEDWLSELPTNEVGAIATLANDTPLQILFTSGTTGDPKGIVLTHGNVLASVGPIEDGAKPYLPYERLVHPLRILHTLPLSHVFGQTMGLWVPPILRAELHFESRLAAPRLIELIKTERISVLAAVPRVLALLKTHLEFNHEGLAERAVGPPPKLLGGLLRWWRFRKVHREFGFKFWAFVSGGGALPAALEQFWNALGFVLIQGYGMTETSALITLNHPFHVASGTIGKPLPGREVKLGPDGEVLVRGAMISGATWQDGALKPRGEEWLATGDIAERDEAGDLRFLGRKSEVIVTANGLNLHPEDIEAVIETQPEVAGCAVVPMQTELGPEPCAVLALRGSGNQAEAVIERANAKLPDFQRIRRWVLWPEPDLPRTSTGKVKRKPVAAWLARTQAAAGATGNGAAHGGNGAAHHGNGSHGPSSDWLLALVAQIAGEMPHGAGDELRLTEDFHLDSLGRVQLAAAIEDRLGTVESNGLLEEVQTLGELRKLVAGDLGESEEDREQGTGNEGTREQGSGNRDQGRSDALPAQLAAVEPAQISAAAPGTSAANQRAAASQAPTAALAPPPRRRSIYPTWPWWPPVQWIRSFYIECLARPFMWILSNPRNVPPPKPLPREPMIIIANHVSSYDAAFMQLALPGFLRRHMAIAMSGDMLDDFLHWRNPWRPGDKRFYPFGPPAWFLVTALYNVFPLANRRDFQSSFMHAGKALDRGYSVMIFPEGTLSRDGTMARFRPGIGLLVKQSSVPVLPMALLGLGELKLRKRKWFHSGTVEVRVGEPIHFAPETSEAEITARLQAEVEKLMGGTSDSTERPEPVATSY